LECLSATTRAFLTLHHHAALDVLRVRSKPSHKQQDNENDQNDADDTDATVTESVTIAAEPTAEATEQESDSMSEPIAHRALWVGTLHCLTGSLLVTFLKNVT
jgi:hypothetical protein